MVSTDFQNRNTERLIIGAAAHRIASVIKTIAHSLAHVDMPVGASQLVSDMYTVGVRRVGNQVLL